MITIAGGIILAIIILNVFGAAIAITQGMWEFSEAIIASSPKETLKLEKKQVSVEWTNENVIY
jgi:hypothetical protein